MSNARRVADVLSALIGVADIILKDRGIPVDPARLVDLDTEIDEARTLMIEGGNLIGSQCSMLIECLSHVCHCRNQLFDRGGETKWRAIANLLLPMVQENLSEALDRLRPVPADRGAGVGQYR